MHFEIERLALAASGHEQSERPQRSQPFARLEQVTRLANTRAVVRLAFNDRICRARVLRRRHIAPKLRGCAARAFARYPVDSRSERFT
jgi:hypothetical protein